MRFIVLGLFLNCVYSFINNIPTKTYNRDFKNIGNYKIIEPHDCNK